MGKCCVATNPQSSQQKNGANVPKPQAPPVQRPQKGTPGVLEEMPTAVDKQNTAGEPTTTKHTLNKVQSPTQPVEEDHQQNGAPPASDVKEEEVEQKVENDRELKSLEVQDEQKQEQEEVKEENSVYQSPKKEQINIGQSEEKRAEVDSMKFDGSDEKSPEQIQDKLDSKRSKDNGEHTENSAFKRLEVIIDQETAIDDIQQKDQIQMSSAGIEKSQPKEEYQHMKNIAASHQAEKKVEIDRVMTEALWNETEGNDGPPMPKEADKDRDFIMQLQEPFKTTSEMSVVWASGVEGKPLAAYDGFANFCLEITYQQFLKDKSNTDYRFVNFQPNLIIDLQEMIETNEKFQETGKVVQRFLPSKRRQQNTMFTKIFDPVTSYKLDMKPQGKSFFRKKELKEFSPLKRISDDNVTWLANEWIKQNGPNVLPNRQQILDGIIDEDRKEVLRLYPRYKETHAAVEEVLKKRAQAWKTFCSVAGFSIKNMEAEIKVSQIDSQPYHPLTTTILQIMITDSPIRNAISRASYEQKAESVKSLGPICVMLKHLINIGMQKREQDELRNQDFWIGAQLSKSEIGSLESMSQANEAVNLLGNQTSTDHESAIDQAFKNKPNDKEAVLIKLTLDPKSGYLPLRKHLSIPEAQHMVLLEDGIGLQVVAITQSEIKMKVKGQIQQYKLIELKSRA